MIHIDYLPEYPRTSLNGTGYCVDVRELLSTGGDIGNLFKDVSETSYYQEILIPLDSVQSR